MSIFTRLAAAAQRVYRALTLDEWSNQISSTINGSASQTGMLVNADQAMRIATVHRCVRVLSESIGSLPLLLYQRDGEDRKLATGHPLFDLLHAFPNPEMSAMQVIEFMVMQLQLRGNALCRKVYNGAGRLVELWPIPWDWVTVQRHSPTAPLLYQVHPTNTYGLGGSIARAEVLRRDQVWHVAGLGWDGVTGLSPVAYAREAFGLSLATEGHGAALFRNGARISGIVEHPGVIKDDEYARYKASWDEAYAGVTNAGKTAFLERGAKFQKVTLTNDEAQFLETRKFQVAEICRIYGVPRHMVYDHDTQPRANMEQAGTEFVVYSLRPWLKRIEQTAARDLLDPSDRADVFPEFLVDALLRGDFKGRQEAYRIGREGGWLCPNDVRQLENMNRLPPEKGGDDYLRPSNMTVAGEKPQPAPAAPPPAPPTPPDPAEDPKTEDPAPSARELKLLEGAAARAVRREIEGVRKAAKGEAGELVAFYSRHGEFLVEALAVGPEAAGRYVTAQLKVVLAAIAAGGDAVERMLAAWERDLPRRILEEVGCVRAPVR